jgi:pyruvate carboxylase subunit B
MEFEFACDGQNYKLSIEKKKEKYLVTLDGQPVDVDVKVISANALSLLLGERSVQAYVADGKGKKHVAITGEEYLLDEVTPGEKRFAKGAIPGAEEGISTPMPGKVVKVLVSVGEEVRAHQSLLIVEAMKMENEISTPKEGVVKEIFVKPGDLVNPGDPLVHVE